MSVGLDRRVCEYDLENSSLESGFLCQLRTGNEEIKAPRRDSVKSNNSKYASYETNEEKMDHTQMSKTDITGKPTAIMWHPRMNVTDIEEKFFTANTEYKLKEFNAHSKECRKTTLAPVFSDKKNANFFNSTNTLTSAHKSQSDFFYNFISGAPNRLVPIRINGWVTHYAYSCPENIIGVGSFPLTGNPAQVFIHLVSSFVIHFLYYVLPIYAKVLAHDVPHILYPFFLRSWVSAHMRVQFLLFPSALTESISSPQDEEISHLICMSSALVMVIIVVSAIPVAMVRALSDVTFRVSPQKQQGYYGSALPKRFLNPFSPC